MINYYISSEEEKVLKANKKTLIISIAIIIVLILVLVRQANYFEKGYLRAGQVTSIETFWGNESKSIYTNDNNQNEIKNLISAYNEAKLYDNNVGTTHDYRIEIRLANGEKIAVLGGSQGFQTVIRGGKQFNIKGEKLWSYFKQQQR